MNYYIEELRMSRAFATAFYDAMLEGKVEVPPEVLEKFKQLKEFYDYQMSREMT